MATIYKTPNKRWIAAIRRKNSPSISKVFDKHSDAKKWALIEEQKNHLMDAWVHHVFEPICQLTMNVRG